MKNLVRSIIILLFPLTAISQKEYFIYLQSEGEQPFFVRLEDKTYPSSPAGYLILSKLKDTTHTFIVGFPQNKWPEQRFSVAVRSKDHGYLLKNFAEKGWGLFNLQTMEVQMAAGNAAMKKKNNVANGTVSLFTEILSKAANDPSLTEEPEFAVVKQNTEPSPPVRNTVSEPVAVKQEVKAHPQLPDSSNEKSIAKPGTKDVQKPMDKATEKPLEQTVDTGGAFAGKLSTDAGSVARKDNPQEPIEKKPDNKAVVDSVKIVATAGPVNPSKEKQSAAVTGSEQVKETAQTINDAPTDDPGKPPVASKDYERSEVVKKSERSTTNGFGLTFIDKIGDFRQDTIEIFIPNPKSVLVNSQKTSADDKRFLDIREGDGAAQGQQAAVKKDCAAIASEKDFFRLRKKMAAEKESESMINEAKKEFKTKCFTVDQIRNLGNLFLNEAGKYQFYEMAYPGSADKTGFESLQSELRDPYFVHRFKNLVN